jgi:hypothetical protein
VKVPSGHSPPSRPGHPSCPCPAVRGGTRWRGAPRARPGGVLARVGGARGAGRRQARAPAGAEWQGVGGRGRWKRPFDFPILKATLHEGGPEQCKPVPIPRRCTSLPRLRRPGSLPSLLTAGGEVRLRGTARGAWARDGEPLVGSREKWLYFSYTLN